MEEFKDGPPLHHIDEEHDISNYKDYPKISIAINLDPLDNH